jgi:hypothetical protein
MNVPYTSLAAFRRALTDRLRRIAQPNGPWPLSELQRQFGYDRLLARLYHVDDQWIIKGATARHGTANRTSIRYKDLVDLVALVSRAAIPAGPQQRALDSEAQRRHLALPDRFDVPDLAQWRVGYAAEARRAINLPALTLDQALAAARPFIEPLLNHTAVGSWNPQDQCWTNNA